MNTKRSSNLKSRRHFLADTGMGFTGLALGSMLHDETQAAAPTQSDGKTHHPAKAQSVIWIFLAGGVSQMESFDVKPALNKYDKMTYDQTPYKDFINKERVEKNSAAVTPPFGATNGNGLSGSVESFTPAWCGPK